MFVLRQHLWYAPVQAGQQPDQTSLSVATSTNRQAHPTGCSWKDRKGGNHRVFSIHWHRKGSLSNTCECVCSQVKLVVPADYHYHFQVLVWAKPKDLVQNSAAHTVVDNLIVVHHCCERPHPKSAGPIMSEKKHYRDNKHHTTWCSALAEEPRL